MLKSERERMGDEAGRAKKLSENTQKELEELQAKVQRQQELAEQLNGQRSDERSSAEKAKQKLENLQKELAIERAERERLDDQQALLRADLERAQQAELAVREMMATSSAQFKELETHTLTCQAEAASARIGASNAQRQREVEGERAEALRRAAAHFGDSVRAQVDLVVRSLSEDGRNRDRDPEPLTHAAEGGLVSADLRAKASSVEAPSTPQQARPRGTSHGEELATERRANTARPSMEDDEPGAATSQEPESAATQVSAPASPAAADELELPGAAAEASAPQSLPDTHSPLMEDRSPPPWQSPPPEAPLPTLPAQALPWACVLGGDSANLSPAMNRAPVAVSPAGSTLGGDGANLSPAATRAQAAVSPAGSTAPVEASLVAETAFSPSPAKRLKLG